MPLHEPFNIHVCFWVALKMQGYNDGVIYVLLCFP